MLAVRMQRPYVLKLYLLKLLDQPRGLFMLKSESIKLKDKLKPIMDLCV